MQSGSSGSRKIFLSYRAKARFFLKFVDITFPEAGKYQVEVLLNGEILRYYPIILAQEKEGG